MSDVHWEEVRMFDLPAAATPPSSEPLSKDRRRTELRRSLLERKIHPTTRRPLAGNGETCRTCAHLLSHHRTVTYWKCAKVAFTFGPSSDVRLSWPACCLWETSS